jgi:hypothetical protein
LRLEEIKLNHDLEQAQKLAELKDIEVKAQLATENMQVASRLENRKKCKKFKQ